jgi:protein tyrosine phosphatase domain-containing protein 1
MYLHYNDKFLVSVYFYNFGWKDYGEATLTSLLDMVKVMAFAVTEGKVAIHCHAGESTTDILSIHILFGF